MLADVPEIGRETPLALHCVGGFVIAMCYDLQRPTGDSELAKKHRLFIDAGSRVATLPISYATD